MFMREENIKTLDSSLMMHRNNRGLEVIDSNFELINGWCLEVARIERYPVWSMELYTTASSCISVQIELEQTISCSSSHARVYVQPLPRNYLSSIIYAVNYIFIHII